MVNHNILFSITKENVFKFYNLVWYTALEFNYWKKYWSLLRILCYFIYWVIKWQTKN